MSPPVSLTVSVPLCLLLTVSPTASPSPCLSHRASLAVSLPLCPPLRLPDSGATASPCEPQVAPGGGKLRNGILRSGSPGFADFADWPAEFLAPMPQTAAQAQPAKKKGKKPGADPVLEYERKAFRLEQVRPS